MHDGTRGPRLALLAQPPLRRSPGCGVGAAPPLAPVGASRARPRGGWAPRLAQGPGGREARAGDLRALGGAGRAHARPRFRPGRSPPTGPVAAHRFAPLSGRIASRLDGDGGGLSGAVGTVAHVGVPDRVLATLAAAVAHGRRERAGGWRGGRRDRRPRPAGGQGVGSGRRVGPRARGHARPRALRGRSPRAVRHGRAGGQAGSGGGRARRSHDRHRRPPVQAISRTHVACRKASTKTRVCCVQA